MKKILCTMTLFALASCSMMQNKELKPDQNKVSEESIKSVNPALDTALMTLENAGKLVNDVNYIKGFNTSNCMNTQFHEYKVPPQMSILTCACLEEVKELILKEDYVKSSAGFRNSYVENMCTTMTMTYFENPDLIKGMAKEHMGRFSDPMPLFLLRDESQLYNQEPSEPDALPEIPEIEDPMTPKEEFNFILDSKDQDGNYDIDDAEEDPFE